MLIHLGMVAGSEIVRKKHLGTWEVSRRNKGGSLGIKTVSMRLI